MDWTVETGQGGGGHVRISQQISCCWGRTGGYSSSPSCCCNADNLFVISPSSPKCIFKLVVVDVIYPCLSQPLFYTEKSGHLHLTLWLALPSLPYLQGIRHAGSTNKTDVGAKEHGDREKQA
ncbi:hypothetical protein FALCPG4_001091 [Fusarium falciforme]